LEQHFFVLVLVVGLAGSHGFDGSKFTHQIHTPNSHTKFTRLMLLRRSLGVVVGSRVLLARNKPFISPSFLSTAGKVSSEDSARDFHPEQHKKVALNSDDEVQAWLKQAVADHKVLLFMKGSPEAPQCGFSRKVALILKDHKATFSSVDVLKSPEIREGVKTFSNWPTIPQLYIGAEFVGGCDIVTSLAESGELKKQLEAVNAITGV
jgi:monothiol glutaredoxin